MRIHLPNSAHLQNIEGFIRKFSPTSAGTLSISSHKQYVHVHPFALAMAACLGRSASESGAAIKGKVQNVASAPYLVRMKLFDHLQVRAPLEIKEHEEAGRFIPLTQIKTSDELSAMITELIPLLHAPPEVADPIKYVFSELGRNVLEHAGSSVGCIACAQYFRNKKRIAIGMADAGRGILSTIGRHHRPESEADAFRLSLTPGISGATARIGGNETNAGAGLFFIRSIAKVTGNFFAMYSGSTLYKLQRTAQTRDSELHANPLLEHHSIRSDLPKWQGTVIGIDISVDETAEFGSLLAKIREAYKIDVKKQKKAYYKKARFV